MPDRYIHHFLNVEENHHAGDCELRSSDITPNCDSPWSVSQTRLHGGKQEGVDLITIDNGAMAIRIIPTRGMGILDVTAGDLRLGWDSPVKEVVNPAFIDLNARGGTGWLDGFNEYLVRCGLEFLGPPCEDNDHAAIGEPAAANITLHGKIANTPASHVELSVEREAPYRITLRGIVHERAMYGPKLELHTELTIVPGEMNFTVRDTITNRGGQTQECGILYHLNHGKGLLEDGAQLITPKGTAVTPRDAGYTDEDIAQWNHYGPPVPGSTEQVFFLDLPEDAEGRSQVMLQNAQADRAVVITFSKKQLPHFVVWKALHDERDGYVTGLEPCTTLPNPRPVEREADRLIKLKPSESYATELSFLVLTNATGVTEVMRSARSDV